MTMPRHQAAFSLIELLVVLTIIALLAAMLIPAVTLAMFTAKATVTKQRMQQVVTALSSYAQVESSACLALQSASALGGAGSFSSLDTIRYIILQGGAGRSQPADVTGSSSQSILRGRISEVAPPLTGAVAPTWYTTQWPNRWPETDWMAATPGGNPPILRFPWGKPGLRRNLTPCEPDRPATDIVSTFGLLNVPNRWVAVGNSAAGSAIWKYTVEDGTRTSPVNNNYTIWRSDGTSLTTVQANQPVPFDAGWMTPLATLRLLQAAGTLQSGTVGETDFRTNRSPTKDWNDRWGNPLLVVYALFVPERAASIQDSSAASLNERDRMLKAALEQYSYNRALYLSVAGPGPKLAVPVSTWTLAQEPVTLRDLWKEVRTVAGAAEWTEDSFKAPPWSGVRQKRSAKRTAFLSAPLEIK